eukprot:Rmarinus@m.13383
MLTPQFEVRQDDEFVIVDMNVKFIKSEDMDFYILGKEFKFHVKPYFLRLTFRQEIVEDGREKVVYDPGNGKVLVHLPKKNHGEYFESLDMLTSLLAPQKPKTKPLIQVVGEAKDIRDDADDDDGSRWEVFQQLPSPEEDDVGKAVYGFDNSYSGVFAPLRDDLRESVDLPDADTCSVQERRVLRENAEEHKFDAEHYAADFADEMGEIRETLAFRSWWETAKEKMQPAKAPDTGTNELSGRKEESTSVPASPSTSHSTSHSTSPTTNAQQLHSIREASLEAVHLSEDEKEAMRRLPNKEFLLADENRVLLSLVDLLYGYAYDYRTTSGDSNVESGWTISKLSATLSWLERWDSTSEVAKACVRRTLCFPLYRHWQLSMKVLEDVIQILQLGNRAVVKCLLGIHHTLQRSDAFFVLNDIYVTDYCVWAQRVSIAKLHQLATALQHSIPAKDEFDAWGLQEIESEVTEVLGQQQQ